MIRRLESKDISACARIHWQNSQAWSHNAQMGTAHLENIYRTILGAEECFGYGYFRGTVLICFITATNDYFKTMERLKKLITFRKMLGLLGQIFKNPADFLDLVEAKFILPSRIAKTGIKPFLLTWHNNFEEEYDPFVPIAVMNSALRDLSARGHMACITQVDANNDKPNRYYRARKAECIYASKWNNLYKVLTVKNTRLKEIKLEVVS